MTIEKTIMYNMFLKRYTYTYTHIHIHIYIYTYTYNHPNLRLFTRVACYAIFSLLINVVRTYAGHADSSQRQLDGIDAILSMYAECFQLSQEGTTVLF